MNAFFCVLLLSLAYAKADQTRQFADLSKTDENPVLETNPCTEELILSQEAETLSEVRRFKNPASIFSYLICTDVDEYQVMECAVGTHFDEALDQCIPEGYVPPRCGLNQEIVLDKDINTLTCKCVDGFTGIKCDIKIDECALKGGNQACSAGGGKCVDQMNTYYCSFGNGVIGLDAKNRMKVPCTSEAWFVNQTMWEFPVLSQSFIHCESDTDFVVKKCPGKLWWNQAFTACTKRRPRKNSPVQAPKNEGYSKQKEKQIIRPTFENYNQQYQLPNFKDTQTVQVPKLNYQQYQQVSEDNDQQQVELPTMKDTPIAPATKNNYQQFQQQVQLPKIQDTPIAPVVKESYQQYQQQVSENNYQQYQQQVELSKIQETPIVTNDKYQQQPQRVTKRRPIVAEMKPQYHQYQQQHHALPRIQQQYQQAPNSKPEAASFFKQQIVAQQKFLTKPEFIAPSTDYQQNQQAPMAKSEASSVFQQQPQQIVSKPETDVTSTNYQQQYQQYQQVPMTKLEETSFLQQPSQQIVSRPEFVAPNSGYQKYQQTPLVKPKPVFQQQPQQIVNRPESAAAPSSGYQQYEQTPLVKPESLLVIEQQREQIVNKPEMLTPSAGYQQYQQTPMAKPDTAMLFQQPSQQIIFKPDFAAPISDYQKVKSEYLSVFQQQPQQIVTRPEKAESSNDYQQYQQALMPKPEAASLFAQQTLQQQIISKPETFAPSSEYQQYQRAHLVSDKPPTASPAFQQQRIVAQRRFSQPELPSEISASSYY